MRIQEFELSSTSVTLPITPDASVTGFAFLSPEAPGAIILVDDGQGEVPYNHGMSFQFRNYNTKRTVFRVRTLGTAYTGKAYLVYLQHGEELGGIGISAPAANSNVVIQTSAPLNGVLFSSNEFDGTLYDSVTLDTSFVGGAYGAGTYVTLLDLDLAVNLCRLYPPAGGTAGYTYRTIFGGDMVPNVPTTGPGGTPIFNFIGSFPGALPPRCRITVEASGGGVVFVHRIIGVRR